MKTRLHNFLKDDLRKLEHHTGEIIENIIASGKEKDFAKNIEEIEMFFSYWKQHINDLEKRGNFMFGMTEEESLRMQYDNFIKEYILPNEDEGTRLKYYQGNLEFDEDYILETAKHNNIVIKDL